MWLQRPAAKAPGPAVSLLPAPATTPLTCEGAVPVSEARGAQAGHVPRSRGCSFSYALLQNCRSQHRAKTISSFPSTSDLLGKFTCPETTPHFGKLSVGGSRINSHSCTLAFSHQEMREHDRENIRIWKSVAGVIYTRHLPELTYVRSPGQGQLSWCIQQWFCLV